MNDNENNPTPQTGEVASVFRSINLMSVGVAALLSTGMIVDRHSVTVSVLSGVGFYGAIAGLLILWQPGALPAVLINHQREITLRRRDELPYRVQWQQQQVRLADLPQIEYTHAVAPALPLQSHLGSFVPAHPPQPVSRRVVAVAAGWATQLFNTETGEPNPIYITPKAGQVQVKSPQAEVVKYLSALEMVEVRNNQLYWQRDTYPTLTETLNAIRTGVHPQAAEGGRGRGEGGYA
jgi:hypothetical protein